MSIALKHHRFTTDQFLAMAEKGILGEDERVELLEGEIVDMSPIGKRHVEILNRLNWLFAPHLAKGRFIVSIQGAIRLDTENLPQPDLCLLQFREDFYREHLAEPGEILLLIEVADSSLRLDRQVKSPLYAAAGIAEYWIVDLSADRIEVHRRPEAGQWREQRSASRGDTIAPLFDPALQFSVEQLLGPPESETPTA